MAERRQHNLDQSDDSLSEPKKEPKGFRDLELAKRAHEVIQDMPARTKVGDLILWEFNEYRIPSWANFMKSLNRSQKWTVGYALGRIAFVRKLALSYVTNPESFNSEEITSDPEYNSLGYGKLGARGINFLLVALQGESFNTPQGENLNTPPTRRNLPN